MSEPSPSPDLDLRLVRYFTVVAEHQHFGRAAEALHVAQPSLSRQIRHLEQQLGARLLDRTPQGSRLTEAGEVFLPLARALLRSADQAAARTRAAAPPCRIDPRPDGSPAPDGPLVEAIEDKNELIAAGQAVAVIPAGVAVGSPRPDLTTIPLDGVEPSHVVLATRAGDRGRLVAAFRKCA